MVRQSKQEQRRNRSPRKHRPPSKKTGPKKDNLSLGFKEHANAVSSGIAVSCFIPKIK
ncbi:MAG: hypothetical protein WB791_03615 [Waddliaceae bacterium]